MRRACRLWAVFTSLEVVHVLALVGVLKLAARAVYRAPRKALQALASLRYAIVRPNLVIIAMTSLPRTAILEASLGRRALAACIIVSFVPEVARASNAVPLSITVEKLALTHEDTALARFLAVSVAAQEGLLERTFRSHRTVIGRHAACLVEALVRCQCRACYGPPAVLL